MNLTEVLVALAIAVGVAGIIVPVLPGTVLILGALVFWAWTTGGTTAWVVLAVATTILVVGTVVKYAIPGKQLKASGVPAKTLWLGAALAVVGFFVVPVVGLLIGFVLGVYVAERWRVGARDAWSSTVAALRAVGVSILIELVAALLATLVWGVGLVLT